MTKLVITATDTDVGKTVFSAALVAALGFHYWKPIQAGTRDGTDRQTVADLSGAAPAKIVPERYVLSVPASPHFAAACDGIDIDPVSLDLPETSEPLIIEGAGGALVPLTPNVLQIDVFARWGLPVVVCARTGLGTINHSLLTLEALRRRNIPVLGIAYIGEENRDTQATIEKFGNVKVLGRLPRLDPLNTGTLSQAFHANFNRQDFLP